MSKLVRLDDLAPGELEYLKRSQRLDWQRLAQQAKEEGPVGSRQYFRELLEPMTLANLAAVTGTAEAALIAVSPWTALAANSVRAGQVFKLNASGVITTPAASPGTLTITPRWGTSTSGTSLGASAASGTLTTSQTNVPWNLDAMLAVRAIGSAGSAVLWGRFQANQVGINALNFGGTVATIDTTVAAGLFLGVTLGSASDSMTPQIAVFEALN